LLFLFSDSELEVESPYEKQTRKSSGWGAGGSEFFSALLFECIYIVTIFRACSNFFAKDERHSSAQSIGSSNKKNLPKCTSPINSSCPHGARNWIVSIV
jgi:hypothetical protein